jgi:hypothetical protein
MELTEYFKSHEILEHTWKLSNVRKDQSSDG